MLTVLISFLVRKIGKMNITKCSGIFLIATTISSYELKDIACHDVMEEAVDLHLRFAAPSGRCFDKHGMEYQQNDTIRSCCGCLTFQCVGNFQPTTHRYEYFWSARSESDVDQRCCLSCEGKVFPEGTEMGISSTEVGNCTTEATTSCLYNPATGRGEITEDHSLKDCCLDSEGLHQITSEVMEPATCSIRECKGTSDRHGHSTPFWVIKRTFPDCNCCHLDGTMIPPGGWILSTNTLNFTCCEGKLMVEKSIAPIETTQTSTATTLTATRTPTTTSTPTTTTNPTTTTTPATSTTPTGSVSTTTRNLLFIRENLILELPSFAKSPCEVPSLETEYPDGSNRYSQAGLDPVLNKLIVCSDSDLGCNYLQSGKWVKTTSMTLGRTAAGASNSGKGWLVTGGLPDRKTYKATNITDLLAGRNWTAGPTLPLSLAYHCQVQTGSGVIITTGGLTSTGSSIYRTRNAYSLATNWSMVPGAMITARDSHACSEHDGELYVMGGVSNSYAPLDSVEILNLTTGQWRAGPTLNFAVYASQAITYNGELYLIGGVGSGGKILKLNSKTNKWDTVATTGPTGERRFFPAQIIHPDSCLTDQIIVVKGYNYKYFPWTQPNFYFKAQATSDVVILFASGINSNGYEIVIGGWDNSQSVIRRGKQGTSLSAYAQTPGILSPSEFRGFWITTEVANSKLQIQVGKDGESVPFMTGVDNSTPLQRNYVAVATWGSHTATYKF